MNILFIGDIVGRLGRKAVTALYADLVNEHSIDFAVANVENLAHGHGVTEKTLQEMADLGIHCFTSGNHIWRNPAVFDIFEKKSFSLMRPLNYPASNPGCGYLSFNISQKNIYVLNLQGRVFMRELVEDPFVHFDNWYTEVAPTQDDIVLVDFHAEATSEKQAFGYYVDGRATAVLGTHTHIQTADERVLEKGTAYITDVGCVAEVTSVLGVDKASIISTLTTGMPHKHVYPETGIARCNAVVVSVGDTVEISRIVKNIEIN